MFEVLLIFFLTNNKPKTDPQKAQNQVGIPGKKYRVDPSSASSNSGEESSSGYSDQNDIPPFEKWNKREHIWN